MKRTKMLAGTSCRRLREKAHLSQKTVADHLHVHPNTVQRWDNGLSISFDHMQQLIDLTADAIAHPEKYETTRGRPNQPYQLCGRRYRCDCYLFRPGHRDHLRGLRYPPGGNNLGYGWLKGHHWQWQDANNGQWTYQLHWRDAGEEHTGLIFTMDAWHSIPYEDAVRMITKS